VVLVVSVVTIVVSSAVVVSGTLTALHDKKIKKTNII
jgi:hypothetical protein